MWTLLSAGAKWRHDPANGAEPDASKAGPDVSKARDTSNADPDARKVGRGHVNGQIPAAHGPTSSNGSLEVRVYMHPGRLPLGRVDLRQAHEQFDLSAARAFGTFEEAEPACASRTGFLLELRGESAALAEHAPSGAVLFVASLRS